MKLWRQFIPLRVGAHSPCPKCDLCLQFTGQPPCTPSEHFIRRIAGERRIASLHWLEEQVSEALYHEELRRGASALDIGLCGPALFHEEAARLLASIRPEFGYFVKG